MVCSPAWAVYGALNWIRDRISRQPVNKLSCQHLHANIEQTCHNHRCLAALHHAASSTCRVLLLALAAISTRHTHGRACLPRHAALHAAVAQLGVPCGCACPARHLRQTCRAAVDAADRLGRDASNPALSSGSTRAPGGWCLDVCDLLQRARPSRPAAVRVAARGKAAKPGCWHEAAHAVGCGDGRQGACVGVAGAGVAAALLQSGVGNRAGDRDSQCQYSTCR